MENKEKSHLALRRRKQYTFFSHQENGRRIQYGMSKIIKEKNSNISPPFLKNFSIIINIYI